MAVATGRWLWWLREGEGYAILWGEQFEELQAGQSDLSLQEDHSVNSHKRYVQLYIKAHEGQDHN